MVTIRSKYHEISSKHDLEVFMEYLNEVDCKRAEPYLASAIMQKAKYAFLPTDKLKYFNRGKKMLENFIEHHPENIEARYVRALVQSEIPRFLGYKNQIKSDAEFIKTHLEQSDLPGDYKKLIALNLNKISS